MAEYYLDLATMMAALQSLRQTGRIEADLPATSLRGKGNIQAGHLTLLVKDGQILSWAIVNPSGEQILSNRNIDISTLTRLYPARIKWAFTPMEPPASASPIMPSQFSPIRNQRPVRSGEAPFIPTPPPQASPASNVARNVRDPSRIPYRTRFLSAKELASIPREYRTIYTLVNGISSVERIAQLIPTSSANKIELFLHELQARGIIDW